MMDSLLIANRGEIACRIIRTAKRLGIRTIAIYSDIDAGAMHVSAADDACCVGPAEALQSYLNLDAILQAATDSNAAAIHPGYGFLSENAAFPSRCADAGIIFVGPPAAAIEAMGAKSAAKAIMTAAGVPVVPGYHGDEQDTATLAAAAERCGYPILLKASAGGGGKGMRVVTTAAELESAIAAVKREAMSAFGDDRLLLERYLQHARHIEFQIFSDRHGNTVHLFERDCSVQRRHQKIIEEAPAPGLDAAQRQTMGEAAVNAAVAIDYEGAGTVEFIVEDEQFFFMEMNTRLQVEHPVTEMITGLDLVEWQLRVAAGEKLPATQDELHIKGHSIEARLYAEDAEHDFLPASGSIDLLEFPASADNLRIDAGVQQGDVVSIYYDPLIAKVIACGRDRNAALAVLLRALENTQLLGVKSNLDYLQRVLGSAPFRAQQLSTGFVVEHASMLQTADDTPCLIRGIAALFHGLRLRASGPLAWRCDGWRQNDRSQMGFYLQDDTATDYLSVTTSGSETVIESAAATRVFSHPTMHGNVLSFVEDGSASRAKIIATGQQISVRLLAKPGARGHRSHALTLLDAPPSQAPAGSSDTALVSPMPGKVLKVLVARGDAVETGQVLMIIEAMKMEHAICAQCDGVVEDVYFAEGETVDSQVQLLSLS